MARLFRSTSRAPRGGLNDQLEKATNELLSAPDWPTTMEICDVVNMDPRWVPLSIQGPNRYYNSCAGITWLVWLVTVDTSGYHV